MKVIIRFSIYLMGALVTVNTVFADDTGIQQDAKAIEVLNSMSTYTASIDRFAIKGMGFADARLGGGLIIANSTEVSVSVDRPGSMHISSFDGMQRRELFFDDGTLTVFSSENKYYAQASIPKNLDAALAFVLEELDVEVPLIDLIYRDASSHLVGSQKTVLYLTDKARIDGTDCHQLAIRGPETDIQLWVEEGDRPLPRRIMITSKWEGGSPRFTANLVWDSMPGFEPDTFVFKAPEGSSNIGFLKNQVQGGE